MKENIKKVEYTESEIEKMVMDRYYTLPSVSVMSDEELTKLVYSSYKRTDNKNMA